VRSAKVILLTLFALAFSYVAWFQINLVVSGGPYTDVIWDDPAMNLPGSAPIAAFFLALVFGALAVFCGVRVWNAIGQPPNSR
jgi:purine-cytosine permease-like protein